MPIRLRPPPQHLGQTKTSNGPHPPSIAETRAFAGDRERNSAPLWDEHANDRYNAAQPTFNPEN